VGSPLHVNSYPVMLELPVAAGTGLGGIVLETFAVPTTYAGQHPS